MYLKCHVCEEKFPVVSVAMLHCRDLKEYDDADDGTWLLVPSEDGGDYVKVPI